MKRRFQILLLLSALLLPATVTAAPDEAMERFLRGDSGAATLVEILPRLADPAQRESIRGKLLEKDAPIGELVPLLEHPMLAVRLGALEVLEELAGGDFSYNPWTPAGSPENEAALTRWKAWAKDPVQPGGKGVFSDEQRRGYLRDLLSDDADKASRARRMLQAEGLSAIGFLEDFLMDTPALPNGHRARIREAQYQITLSRQLGDQAAATARQLAFGSRDQMLSALTTVREAGLLALPILRDFITHPDPLVRESAIDSLLVSGGEPAVEIVAPLLKAERDVNVIHGALRRLKDVPGKTTADLVASFLDHPDEDLLISAIQTCLSLSGDNSSHAFSKPGDSTNVSSSDARIQEVLKDKRWRVRAAALEYVARRKLTAAKAVTIALLEDPDDFVRFAAIKAIASIGATDALPTLKAMFMKDTNMAGPVMEGYAALNQKPDDELLARLDACPTDAKLAALRACESSQQLASVVLRLSSDSDTDVACAALRRIAGHPDRMKDNNYVSVVVAALRSGDAAKVEAVMERIALEKSEDLDPRLLKALDMGMANSEPTALDGLYNSFLLPGKDSVPEAAPKAPVIPRAQEELVAEIRRRITPETPAAERFRAALSLASASYPEGFVALAKDMPTLTTAQKVAITESLDEPSSSEVIPLLTGLLRDPIPEIRKGAASVSLSNDKATGILGMLLTELSRPGALLQAHEVYDYRFESALRYGGLKKQIRDWAVAVLEAPDSPVPLRVLAAIGLQNQSSAAATAALENYKTSPDPLLRRAAWNTILVQRPAEIRNAAETLAADKDAFVRVILPVSLAVGSRSWSHHFSDLVVIKDENWSSDETKPRLTEALQAQLENLATRDPSPLVRFEAAFSLLTHGKAPDINALVALVPQMPEEAAAKSRVSHWLSQNAARATPGLAPLLAIVDPARIGKEEMKTLNERLNPARKDGFATFASLAKSEAGETKEGADLLTEAAEPEAPVQRESLAVVYFYKPGCPECTRAKDYLKTLQAEFPLLKITEHNILEASGTVLNQALCQRFSVPSAKHTLSPAIFTQAGFRIRDDISPKELADLFTRTMSLPEDDSWMEMDKEEVAAASEVVDRRYAAFTLPVVLGAGLLDGINPCAFATMIFFLSYLQVARRTPREMLMVGAAFISAVFIAYLAAGLVLYQSLAALNERFSGIQKWMNIGFAALALLAAFLSFRDAWRARGGRMDEMTLQLPGFLKDRIRSVIRTGSRARNFVIAAFVSGLVISLLELACTGQVYAPIIYQIQQGKLDAIVWLVVYNLAFITPLVVIFLLAYGGLRSESLINFQKKHTASVKIGLGLLFLVLALMILFGQRWLGPQ